MDLNMKGLQNQNVLNDSKTLAGDLVNLAKQEKFSNFKRRVAEGAPTKEEDQLASDIQHLTEYDHDAMRAWLLDPNNRGYLDSYLPSSLDGALQQIANRALTVDELGLDYQVKLDQYYAALIDNALLRLPKSE